MSSIDQFIDASPLGGQVAGRPQEASPLGSGWSDLHSASQLYYDYGDILARSSTPHVTHLTLGNNHDIMISTPDLRVAL